MIQHTDTEHPGEEGWWFWTCLEGVMKSKNKIESDRAGKKRGKSQSSDIGVLFWLRWNPLFEGEGSLCIYKYTHARGIT